MILRNTIFSILFLTMIHSVVWAETPSVSILLYHGLTDICPGSMYEKRKDRFYRDMEYIRDNFDVISLLELQDIIDNKKTLSRNTIVITFDDGMLSNYNIAVPILKEFGFPATFFIISDKPENDDWFMNWEQIKELSQVTKDGEYLFTIGSHSKTHEWPGLQDLAGDALRYELEESKRLIDIAIEPRRCETFAVPFGIFPQDEAGFRNLATELGYKVIRTSEMRNVDISIDESLNLPCLPLYDFTEPEYIGAFNQSPTPLLTPLFEPAQDVFIEYNPVSQSYEFDVKISDITSYETNSQNITIKAVAENDDMIQSITVTHQSPWDIATIHITTKEGVCGRTKINIEATEPGTFPSSGYFHVNIAPAVVIISYNGITADAPDNIYQRSRQEMEKDLKFIYDQEYEVISMEDMLKVRAGEKFVQNKVFVLCFDDGGVNDYDFVVPVLQQYGFKAIFFIVPEWVGTDGYMNWDNIQTMLQQKDQQGNRLFSVGSHSYAHEFPGYLDLTSEEILHDLALSKETIENNTSAECNFFALPFGARADDSEVASLAASLGYKGIRSPNDTIFDVLNGNYYDMRSVTPYSYTTVQYFASLFERPRIVTPPLIDPIDDIETDIGKDFVVDIKGIASTYFSNNQKMIVEVDSDNPSLFDNLSINYLSPNTEAKLDISLKPQIGEANVTVKVHEKLGVSGSATFHVTKSEAVNCRNVTILVYHGLIDGCPRSMYEKRKDRFYNDMMYIKEHLDVISLSDLQDVMERRKTLERDAVVITFDKGMKSNYDIAVPILQELKFPATFFIVGSFPGDDDFFMTWQQIKELSQMTNDKGEFLFTIGSNTYSAVNEYPGLKDLTGNELRYELEESKRLIDQYITPRRCEALAVPFGLLPENEIEFRNIATESGYKIIRASLEGENVDFIKKQLLNLPSLLLYDFTEPEYIGAFNQEPIKTPIFEPVQDVFSEYSADIQSYTFKLPVKGILSQHSWNSKNITIKAVPEDNDLIQSIDVIHEVPWDIATIRVTTKEGVYGRVKVNIELSEPGTFPSSGYFYVTVGPVVEIISYNGLTSDTPGSVNQRHYRDFVEDMEFIHNQNYEVISMDDLLKIRAGEKTIKNKMVVLCFDDGGINDFQLAKPVLQQYGYPATFFIVPDWVGKNGYMSWDNIKTMLQEKDSQGNRLFSVGSHSYYHIFPGYQDFTNEQILEDLRLSKESIENNTSSECNFFAFPYGKRAGDIQVMSLAESVGYKGMRTANNETFDVLNGNIYEMGTLTMFSYTTPQCIASFFENPRLTPPIINPIRDVLIRTNYVFTVDIKGIESTYYSTNEAIIVEVETDNPQFFEELISIDYQAPGTTGKLFMTPKLKSSGEAYVTVKVHEGLGIYGTATFKINSVITGEKEFYKEPFILFPNPATDHIEIKNVDETVLYKIYNATGSLVLAGRGNKIDISPFPQGVYIIAIYSGNEEFTTLKIVKN